LEERGSNPLSLRTVGRLPSPERGLHSPLILLQLPLAVPLPESRSFSLVLPLLAIKQRRSGLPWSAM
jgi:hypothetical protein